MLRFRALALPLFLLAARPCSGDTGLANGWRGNGTGLWPESQAPLEWSRSVYLPEMIAGFAA
jgi:hypothetical protein